MSLPVIKTQITYMEMTSPNAVEGKLPGYEIRHEKKPDVDWYLDLYRDIGRDYIWNYRPGQTREEVEGLIHSDKVEIHALYKDGKAVGMAELDVSKPDDVEIVHFGLLPSFLHQGIGAPFLQAITSMLWQRGVKRIWLSTCGLDHPKAISFYKKYGFSVFKTREGEFKDYRYTDFYNKDDAPLIPHGIAYFNCQEGSHE